MARHRFRHRSRDFDRTERVSELVRRIVAEELERMADERLDLVAVSGVDVDRDLNVAEVFYSSLDDEHDDEILEALTEHRARLRSAVGRQARLRKTPDLVFRPDHGIRGGERLDEVLRGLNGPDDGSGEGGPA